jgi:mRNA-degrading endonuclease YafQ of YafQ-DinJ toxin-antitoxin module
VPAAYRSLEITPQFLQDLVTRRFSERDRSHVLRALDLLDENERHASLRVHELSGPLAGTWSASASDELRITFERLPNGRKRILTCSHHYAR